MNKFHDLPVNECAEKAQKMIDDGLTVFQKYVCEECGSRQTMTEPNTFFSEGECQECHHVTKITECGFLAAALIPVGDSQTSPDPKTVGNDVLAAAVDKVKADTWIEPPAEDLLRQFLDKIIEGARQNLTDFGRIEPVAFLVNSNDKSLKMVTSDTQFSSPEAKDRLAEAIRNMAFDDKACACFFVSEAWSLSPTSLEAYHQWQKENPGKSIADHPDKVEVMIVSCEVCGKIWSGAWTLDKATRTLSDPHGMQEKFFSTPLEKSEGRFTEFLPYNYIEAHFGKSKVS